MEKPIPSSLCLVIFLLSFSFLFAQDQSDFCKEVRQKSSQPFTGLTFSLHHQDSIAVCTSDDLEASFYLNDPYLAEHFTLTISSNEFLQKSLGDALTYRASGIRLYLIHLANPQNSELIYQNDAFSKTFSKNLEIEFEDIRGNKLVPGLTYEIRITELIQIGCNNEKWPVNVGNKLDFFIKIGMSIKEDPIIQKLGYAELLLLHNGKKYQRSQQLKKEDKLEIHLRFKKDPANDSLQKQFWVNGYGLEEKSEGRGMINKKVFPRTYFPIAVPHSAVAVDFKGVFGIQLGEIRRKDPNGNIYGTFFYWGEDYLIFRKME